MSDLLTFQLSSLKGGYKSSDQVGDSKLNFDLANLTTWFDQHWSSSGNNCYFYNSHPCGADLPRI